MAVPEKRKIRNIQKSIIKFVDTNFRSANSIPESRVNYRNKVFDESKLNYWVSVDFLTDQAGKKGFSLVQFTANSRVAADTDGDPYGDKALELIDQLQDALHVETIQIYDFTANPETVISKAKIIVENSDGKLREPEEIRSFELENDVLRVAATFRFKTLSDIGAGNYYD